MRAALSAAVLYAFCALAPHVALAFGNSAHCLTQEHGAAHIHKASTNAPHSHADGTVHDHAGAQSADEISVEQDEQSNSGKVGAGNCCGIFCVSAMASSADAMLLAPSSFESAPPGRADALTGRDPGPAHRPPIG